MPELKRNFLKGTMELDLDDRLVPEGAYREAFNIAISRSDTSDVGALENLRGNRQVPGGGLTLTNSYEVLGTVADRLNDRIYWFFVGPSTEGIYEFDFNTQNVSRILEFDVNKRVFRFNTSHYITGADVIENLLYWTDGLNPPRKINLDRFRGSNLNPTTDSQGNSLVDFTNEELSTAAVQSTPPFLGDIINVGKRPPLFPPIVTQAQNNGILTPEATSGDNLYDNFISFAYRYRYLDGEVTPLSPFSPPAFLPKRLNISRATDTTVSDVVSFASFVNTYSAVDIEYDPGNSEISEVELVLKYQNNANIYSLVVLNKEQSNIPDSTPFERRYQRFRYSDNKVFRVLPEDELTRIFDNVPLTAKAQTIAGNRLVYGNYTENYDLKILNERGRDLVPNFSVQHVADNVDVSIDLAHRTVKSDRDYEVGIVYLDREGRQTPVLLSEDSSVHVPFANNNDINRLSVTINTPAPYWATHYRFFIKQSQGVFYNIFPEYAVKNNTSRKVYLKLDEGEAARNVVEGATQPIVDINKAKEGDRIVLKGIRLNETVRREFIVDEVNVDSAKIIADTSLTMTDIGSDTPFIALKPVNIADLVDDVFPTGRRYGTIWETVPVLDSALDIYAEWGDTYRCVNGAHTSSKEEIIEVTDTVQNIFSPIDAEVDTGTRLDGDAKGPITITLDYFNCFGYTNGIEEVNILGNFNASTFPQGVRFSTVNEEYRRRHQQAFLIHSGIFNDDTNLNRFNEFNTTTLITDELDISNGSIQKLHFRDTNLIVFQEDKVINVPINKNLLTLPGTGDGVTTTSSAFFGTERSYIGEYGISTNPESFATYGNRIYFTDRNRGVMLRLGNNGIEEISKNGIESSFRENVVLAGLVIGSYDDFHDQYLCTLKNRPSQPVDALGADAVDIILSEDGCPDPRAECNRDVNFIEFRQFYSIQREPRTGLMIDDTIFIDSDRTVAFNGNYRWYRIRSNVDQSTNSAVQISPYGDVTGFTNSCSAMFPRLDVKTVFNISRTKFTSALEACANGIVDSSAYFRSADQNNRTDEPIVNDTIFEGELDIVRSTRTGWYLITQGSQKFSIQLQNGIVINKILCDETLRGRRSIVSSGIIPIASGVSDARRNITICLEPFAERNIFFRSDNSIPQVGDILFDNAFDDTVLSVSTAANTNTYYSTIDGYYIRVVTNSNNLTEVMETGLCSELQCFNSPNDLFTQQANPFQFEFSGITNRYDLSTTGTTNTILPTAQPIPNAEITYFVQGNRRYGPLVVNTSTFGFYDFNRVQPTVQTPDPLTIQPSTTITLPAPSDAEYVNEGNVSVTISQVCYRGVSIDTNFATAHLVAFSGDNATTCGLTATTDVYYDPSLPTKRYFNNQQLTTAFSLAAGQYGVTDSGTGTSVERIETIASDGTVTDSSNIFCTAFNLITLGYVESDSTDNRQAACNFAGTSPENAVMVYADQVIGLFSSTQSNHIELLLRNDGTGRVAPDGFYTDGIVIRQMVNGVLMDNDAQGCSSIDPLLPITIQGLIEADEGTNVTLTANSSEAGVTWSWSDVTNGTLVSGGGSNDNIVITRAEQGVASVQLTGSKTGFRDNTLTHTVTFVEAAPRPTIPTATLTGPSNAQTGDNITLTSTSAGFIDAPEIADFVLTGSSAAAAATGTATQGAANSVDFTFTEPLGTTSTTYTITITENAGLFNEEQATATHTVVWDDAPPAPIVQIDSTPSTGTTGANITLRAVAENFGQTPDFTWTGTAAIQAATPVTTTSGGMWISSITFTEPDASSPSSFNRSYTVTATRGNLTDDDTHTVRWTTGAPPTPGLSFTLSESGTTSEPYTGGSNVTISASAVTRTDTGATVPNNELAWTWTVSPASRIVSGGTSSSTSVVVTGTSENVSITARAAAADGSSFVSNTQSTTAMFGALPFSFSTLNVLSSTTSGEDACQQQSTTAFRASSTTLSTSLVLYTDTATSASDTFATDVFIAANDQYWTWDASAASLSGPVTCATVRFFSIQLGTGSGVDEACSASRSEFFVEYSGGGSSGAFDSIIDVRTDELSTASRAPAGQWYSNGTQAFFWDGSSTSSFQRCRGVYRAGTSTRLLGTIATSNTSFNVDVIGVNATFTPSGTSDGVGGMGLIFNDASYTVTAGVNNTNMTASRTFPAGTAGDVLSTTLSFSPPNVTVNASGGQQLNVPISFNITRTNINVSANLSVNY